MRAYGEEPWAALLLSDGSFGAERSFLFRRPARVLVLEAADPRDPVDVVRAFLAERQGMVVGLGSYELGGRFEGLALARDLAWPDLILADYPAWLVFDHAGRTVEGVGDAGAWLEAASVQAGPARTGSLAADRPPAAYEAAVADVVRRIGEGELFQANIAQGWSGVLGEGDTPFQVFERLVADSPSPLAAYWRLEGRALVSHSPERFLSLEARRVRTRPIKGTRPRGDGPEADAALATELAASAKDRAENLMIVDLMRNDLARVCTPGSVQVTALNVVERFAHVWHLVSTVEGELADRCGIADLIGATFPPGSITGAPKHQAMQVIAELEAGPRGPWCGSLMRMAGDREMDSSVLIRTAAFVQTDGTWHWRSQAGAGITADSDPHAERLETEAKFRALRQALAPASSGDT
ncbi:anthranilate synthase component I family protein [Brevundimonas aveniformis]|uniref:anthranilate synthase component I family protein n=1 Tax=Brevundimonas aveniformis TaxID=370977 RepID=UPI00249218D7|nr:anthranilate synthase component I family protein [Brevundimonas aveniformis]